MGKRKGRDPPCELPWRTVVLIEVPLGFAFFDVNSDLFDIRKNMIWAHFTNQEAAQSVVSYLDLIEFDDKSAVWRSDGPGDKLAYWAKEYSSKAKQFVVEDKNLRRLIESNLEIDCFNAEEYVVHEVGWGLRNALPYLVSEYLGNITINRECPLPLCHGFEELMKKYGIVIPSEAVDKTVLTYAGSLQRVDEVRLCRCTEMRKSCDKLVPGISQMIKDNSRYVEVMAKILTPGLFQEWDPSKWATSAGEPWFTPDEMQKIKAIDAAAADARKKVEVDHKLADMIKGNLDDYSRVLPKWEDTFLKQLRSFKVKAMAEVVVVEAAGGRERMVLMSLGVCLKRSEALPTTVGSVGF